MCHKETFAAEIAEYGLLLDNDGISNIETGAPMGQRVFLPDMTLPPHREIDVA
jgi:hypothetical protein